MSSLNYIRRKYSFKGEYLGTESYDPLRYITDSSSPDGPFWLNSTQMLSFMPALKKQTLKATYKTSQLLPDGEFPLSAFADAGDLAQWSGTAQIRRKAINASKEQYGILLGIPANSVAEARYIESTPVFVERGFNISFRISIGFQLNLPPVVQLTPPRIYMQVKVGNYYLSSLGNWGLEPTYAEAFVTEFNKTATLVLEPSTLRESGLLTVRLYELVTTNVPATPENAFLVDDVSVDLLYDGQLMPEELTFEIVNPARCTLVGDELELFHADAPDYENTRLAFKNAVIVNSDTTRKWFRLGKLEQKPIQQLLLEQIMAFSEVPRQKLNGRFRSRELFMSFLLQDELNLPLLFMVGSLSYDTARSEYEVELLEIDATLPETEVEEGERLYEDMSPRKLEDLLLRRLEREGDVLVLSRMLENKQLRYNEDLTLRSIEI
jgi:hypothetical protein